MIDQATNQLLNHDVLLTELVKNTNNAVIITNLQGEIMYTNAAFTSITGYEFEEIAGKSQGLSTRRANEPQNC